MNRNKKIVKSGKPMTVQEILAAMEKAQKQEPAPTPRSSVTGDPYSLLYTVAKTVNNGDSFVSGIASERKVNYVDKKSIKHYTKKALNGDSTKDVVTTSATAVALLERDDEKDM
ncbi:MAG: hypothetical protein IJW28_00585 [Clostridia bacterium]|nr:hypothetical protein [Clostridia bacterium]